MPEIAEVETIKNELLSTVLLKQKIKNINVFYDSINNICKKEKNKNSFARSEFYSRNREYIC